MGETHGFRTGYERVAKSFDTAETARLHGCTACKLFCTGSYEQLHSLLKIPHAHAATLTLVINYSERVALNCPQKFHCQVCYQGGDSDWKF